jgi:hypothetical protein
LKRIIKEKYISAKDLIDLKFKTVTKEITVHFFYSTGYNDRKEAKNRCSVSAGLIGIFLL